MSNLSTDSKSQALFELSSLDLLSLGSRSLVAYKTGADILLAGQSQSTVSGQEICTGVTCSLHYLNTTFTSTIIPDIHNIEAHTRNHLQYNTTLYPKKTKIHTD